MAHDSSDSQWQWCDAPSNGAMAPTPAMWPGGYGEPFPMMSSPMEVARDSELT
jgi:hypothetical protein